MKSLIAARLRATVPSRNPEAEARHAWPEQVATAVLPAALTRAAVLVALVERQSGLAVVLTRRADHLPDHPGQVSLPGGRVEPGEGAREAAVREFHEELRPQPAGVEVVGYLPPRAVVTGFVVTPVVGFVAREVVYAPEPAEVAEVFEVPLAWVLDPANARAVTRRFRDVSLPGTEFHFEGWRIWGATAQVLDSLVRLIRPTQGEVR